MEFLSLNPHYPANEWYLHFLTNIYTLYIRLELMEVNTRNAFTKFDPHDSIYKMFIQ